MTGRKFAELVTNRANERVQKKIDAFRSEIKDTFRHLTGSVYLYWGESDADAKEAANWKILLGIVESRGIDEYKSDWPRLLWEKEEEIVKEEILSTMDELQKALLASTQPGENDVTKEEKTEA